MIRDRKTFFNENGVIHHQGLCILHNYYTQNNKIAEPLFVLKSLDDVILFRKIFKEDCAIIFRNAPSNHKTPLIFKGNNILVLDSLGAKSGGTLAEIEAALNKIPGRKNILSAEPQRQKDYYSCGTEAFIVLKEALRFDKLTHFMDREDVSGAGRSRFMPAEIAKYAQSRRFLMGNLKEFKGVAPPSSPVSMGLQAVSFVSADEKETTVLSNIRIPKRKGAAQGETESLAEYLNRHSGFSAVETRREKHILIIERTLTEKSDADIDIMVGRASGLQLFTGKADGKLSLAALVELYSANLLRKLDEALGVAITAAPVDFDDAFANYEAVCQAYLNNDTTSLKSVLDALRQLLLAIQLLKQMDPVIEHPPVTSGTTLISSVGELPMKVTQHSVRVPNIELQGQRITA